MPGQRGNFPLVDDPVWTQQEGNGIIYYVEKDDGVVGVFFYNMKKVKEVDIDRFWKRYNDRFGQWVLSD